MIVTVPLGMLQANCFLVFDEKSHDGLIIDPGGDVAPLVAEITRHNVQICAILNTHGHFDHVAGNAELVSYAAPYGIHPDDRKLLLNGGGAQWFGMPINPSPEPSWDLIEGQLFSAGSLHFEILHTPGHTPGSVCILVPQENALFSGDLLFAGNIGRTDLPGGNAYAMRTSLKRLRDVAHALDVYPGHGPQTTLAEERQHNPWLRA